MHFLRLYPRARNSTVYGHMASILLVMAVTLVCELLKSFLLPINLLMIYLMTVVLVALKLGLWPALSAVALGGFMYNYLYVPPRFHFDFRDKEYLATFFGLFLTGAVISSLVNKVRKHAENLYVREAETASLYHLSRELAAASDTESILAAVVHNVEESLDAQVELYLAKREKLELVAASKEFSRREDESAFLEEAFFSGKVIGLDSAQGGLPSHVYFPLMTLSKTLGVMAIHLGETSAWTIEQISHRLEAFASQAAMALERVYLSHKAEQAEVLRARHKLERALLNSISHDLRTPLATITGVLSSVLEKGSHLNEQVRAELLETAREEAVRLNRFVGNLLDMTRLEARGAILKLEQCDVQDLIGCAHSSIERYLNGRPIAVSLAADLPLVTIDIALMNQVLINLLENALKYSPVGTPIEVAAQERDGALILKVIDSGPGVPESELNLIFDKFYRVPVPESVQGTGLGLSICKGIVEAHGGKIYAENIESGGFMVTIEVPLTVRQQEAPNA